MPPVGQSDSPTLLPFTAHNLSLADGSVTIPGDMLLEDRPMARAVLRSVDLLFPGRAPQEYSAVDLGCLEGGYTALLARAGFSALGIDGRQANIDRCEFGAGQLDLPGLRFVTDDVRNLERHGVFDLTFCSGLLYHLDNPVDFLHVMSRCTRRALILHTHFATDTLPEQFSNLSELTTNEGVPGRWYYEHPEGLSAEDLLAHPWSSIGNTVSFWIEKRHLLQTLVDVGFDLVYEQYDFLDGIVNDNYIAEYGRSCFIAVRQPA
ncbi:MAG: class I SAM-dependent methyltransferase [Actinomycetota bacterium]|nr:class I SAM-dependent methyltransferase [Actinomycetota bacterium]